MSGNVERLSPPTETSGSEALAPAAAIDQRTFFGGLYQRLILTR